MDGNKNRRLNEAMSVDSGSCKVRDKLGLTLTLSPDPIAKWL